jgi:hypothetical protein
MINRLLYPNRPGFMIRKLHRKTVQFLYSINTFSKIFFIKSGNNTTPLPTFALMNLSGLRLSQHTWGVFSFIEGGEHAV